MLDDYKDLDFYNYVKNLKRYSHAYIIEVDDITTSFPIVKALVKTMICPNHYTNYEKCLNCNTCHLIDENYYEDLKIIEPDGAFIKKEQIQNLQNALSLKSSNNTNQVYILKEADKMNASATNSLLKFLEEPATGIYAILLTTNKNSLLETIISRCQTLTLKTKTKIDYASEDIKNVLNFLTLIHTKKEDSLAYLKSSFLNIYKDKDEILKALTIMENIINQEINSSYQIKRKILPFYDIIGTSLKDISLTDLIFYLDKVVVFKNKLANNPYLNINLFLDRLVIEMSRVVLK